MPRRRPQLAATFRTAPCTAESARASWSAFTCRYHGGGDNWRRRFKLVVGVVHTNYLQYAKMYQPENVAIVAFINRLVCRAYCDRNVKLSDSLQTLCRASVCNVHGVRSEFIEMGRRAAKAAVEAPPLLGFGRRSFEFSGGAYFIGKLLWAKGHRLLIDYLAANEEGADPSSALPDVAVDVYGDGEDANVIKAAASKAGLAVSFPGSRDHADASLHGYKVRISSSSDCPWIAFSLPRALPLAS